VEAVINNAKAINLPARNYIVHAKPGRPSVTQEPLLDRSTWTFEAMSRMAACERVTRALHFRTRSSGPAEVSFSPTRSARAALAPLSTQVAILAGEKDREKMSRSLTRFCSKELEARARWKTAGKGRSRTGKNGIECSTRPHHEKRDSMRDLHGCTPDQLGDCKLGRSAVSRRP
jgi:hypothetical protein